MIENQQMEIAVLVARLSQYENGEADRTPAPKNPLTAATVSVTTQV